MLAEIAGLPKRPEVLSVDFNGLDEAKQLDYLNEMKAYIAECMKALKAWPAQDRGKTFEVAKRELNTLRVQFGRFVKQRFDLITAYTHPLRQAAREIVGREDVERTLLSVMARPEVSNAILLGEAGSGKALNNNTLIPVDDDRVMVPIGKIKVGDKVFGADGKPYPVVAVHPQGYKQVWNVRFETGVVLECCSEHLWKWRAKNVGWCLSNTEELAEIIEQDDVWVPPTCPLQRSETNVCKDPLLLDVDAREAYLKDIVAYSIHDARFDSVKFETAEGAAQFLSLATSLGYKAMKLAVNDGWRVLVSKAHDTFGLRIVAIEPTQEQAQMTCLTVDSPDHTFVCHESHIVTHNTALMQHLAKSDTARQYLEVDLAKMIAVEPDENALGAALKRLFDQVSEYNKLGGSREAVLFIDEFHTIIQISPVATEQLKPLLADSALRGIKVVAATTYREWNEYVSKNQPLVERLERINIREPDEETVVKILRGMAERYGVGDDFKDDAIFHQIYDITQRYIPANAQPRKSLLILDAMIGWHKAFGNPLDTKLLTDVLYESEGINVAFRVDATHIEETLNNRVYAQQLATHAVAKRLQLCVADLNDPNKPMASMLFSGSTGTGKAVTADCLIPVYDEMGHYGWKCARDIVVGDHLFDRCGNPTKVLGVFPQGEKRTYRVRLTDGRYLDVSKDHLWQVYLTEDGNIVSSEVMTTEDMMQGSLSYTGSDGKSYLKYCLPVQGAVQWPEEALPEDEYAVGDYGSLLKAYELGIPVLGSYLAGSVEQRWMVIQGLFDSHGRIDENDFSLTYSTTSALLAEHIRNILFSLGIESFLDERYQEEVGINYILTVFAKNADKVKFFRSPCKSRIAQRAAAVLDAHGDMYDYVGIYDIVDMGFDQEMVCFYVDNDEHLFQAGRFVVTHNTELTKQLAQILFGDDVRSFIGMDGSEFANDDSIDLFRDELTSRVWMRPFCVLLIDEVDKISPKVVKLLLQVLDDGRLMDRNEREVSFKNCYIVMTTNAGAEIFKTIAQYNASDTGDAASMAQFEKVVRRSLLQDGHFPPELMGRVNVIAPFQPLSENTMRKIVGSKFDKLRDSLKTKHSVDFSYTDRVMDYLILDKMDTDSDAGGARRVVSKMEDECTTAVAAYVNAHPEATSIELDIEGQMVNENKNIRESTAHVIVHDLTPANVRAAARRKNALRS